MLPGSIKARLQAPEAHPEADIAFADFAVCGSEDFTVSNTKPSLKLTHFLEYAESDDFERPVIAKLISDDYFELGYHRYVEGRFWSCGAACLKTIKHYPWAPSVWLNLISLI